jgi:hypothetical protein
MRHTSDFDQIQLREVPPHLVGVHPIDATPMMNNMRRLPYRVHPLARMFHRSLQVVAMEAPMHRLAAAGAVVVERLGRSRAACSAVEGRHLRRRDIQPTASCSMLTPTSHHGHRDGHCPCCRTRCSSPLAGGWSSGICAICISPGTAGGVGLRRRGRRVFEVSRGRLGGAGRLEKSALAQRWWCAWWGPLSLGRSAIGERVAV